MSETGHVHIRDTGTSVWITLNRVDRANALTAAMLRQLVEAVRNASHAKVLVFTGVGNVFSAGADLAEVGTGLATDPNWEVLSALIADFSGVTISALNGTVAGGAMGMVLACDFRIAVRKAAFFYPALAKGVDPQPSDPLRCAALVGPSRTAEIFLLGRRLTSDEACDWGLINQVVDQGDLAQETEAFLEGLNIAKADAERITRIKRMINPR